MKKILLTVIAFLLVLTAFTGCTKKEEAPAAPEFADIAWVREAECDVETIRFTSEGEFRYSCACGNPVNDADLCEGYSYDEKTQTLTLNYIEETEESVTTVKVVSFDGKTLVLDFDGDVRTFTQREPETAE